MKEEKEEPEATELEYIEQLMDDFGLEKSNTLGDLLKCLEDEEAGVYDDEGDDGNT